MNLKRWLFAQSIALCAVWLLGTNAAWAVGGGTAFGAPGSPSFWSYAAKQGIGTSYEEYVNKTYQDSGSTNTISKVWFSLAQGIVTETAFGEIDRAQIKDLQFLVTGDGFFDEEKKDTNSTAEMPIMLGWKLWKAGILSDSEIAQWYQTMLKPAAEFLANGGTVNIKYPDDPFGHRKEVKIVPPYGVRPGNDPEIAETVCTLDNIDASDDAKRVKYDFTFNGVRYPGFRRYNYDGYGEQTNDGSNFRDGGQKELRRGRVWPFFTGERGHYELAKVKAKSGGTISSCQVKKLRNTYVRGMEYFANDSFILPEQVWDGVGDNSTHHYKIGEGTNSATPLAWTHAEYVKLVKSLTDKNVWDSYDVAEARY